MKWSTLLLPILFLMACEGTGLPGTGDPVHRRSIPRVDMMPNMPSPYAYRDWKGTTLEFDRYVFDHGARGEFLPLIWWDGMGRNFPDTTFGLYTAIGDVRMGPAVNNGENHEALGALGAVLSASLVGVDKSDQQGRNYVRMLRNYFNRDNGWNVIMNFTNKGAHIGGGYGNDFWYEVHNNVLFTCIADLYPKDMEMDAIFRTVTHQFLRSDSILAGNYACSYFDFAAMQCGKNHIPTQDDVAGGYAFILYSAWVRFGDERYLKGARSALDALYAQKENRFYEAMMPLGAYVAARMNAEQGTDYDLSRFIDWTFNGDAVGREGWGVLVGNWGGYDLSGLVGSTVHNGGYGFLMNTFDLMMPMAAMVRYDQRYARAVGKWALNAANAARFCYPSGLPDTLQAIPQHKSVTRDVIAYEGVIKESIYPEFKGRTPFAQGDGPLWAKGNPPQSMFSVYGSGHVGFFGATLDSTDVPGILRIDTRATDFFRKGVSFPTYLYYNPHKSEMMVMVDAGSTPVDLYDAVSRKILMEGAKGRVKVSVPSDDSVLLVHVPVGSAYAVTDNRLTANGITIDHLPWKRKG